MTIYQSDGIRCLFRKTYEVIVRENSHDKLSVWK